MDCLVQPLQDKIEDWKRTVATIDKDHAKEYKRCRSELKKRSSDTLRLQKKARKGQADNSLQSLMDSHMQDVTLRRAELEEVEKKSLRAAMVEERLRYCSFVHMLQPVVHEECEVMSELGHLQVSVWCEMQLEAPSVGIHDCLLIAVFSLFFFFTLPLSVIALGGHGIDCSGHQGAKRAATGL